jgi:4-amino-4-deoxy-L-arabinose transferase-like glycosyltransferase
VYAHAAWALQRGHRLFDEIFSSQPPLVPWLIAVAFTHTGPSPAAA